MLHRKVLPDFLIVSCQFVEFDLPVHTYYYVTAPIYLCFTNFCRYDIAEIVDIYHLFLLSIFTPLEEKKHFSNFRS